MTRRLRLGTRASALALWQARHVAAHLKSLHPDLQIDEVPLQTEGDRQQERPFGLGDERGVFVRQIEEALLSNQVDLGVHSLKDLPTRLPDGLALAAILKRHDPRDALLSTAGWTWEELPAGAILGTASFRRRTQLLHARPDVHTVPVRGNVDTRVRKLLAGEFDALVVALAGVERLGIRSVEVRPLDLSVCLPAVGQGAIAVETRAADGETREIVERVSHPPSAVAVHAERAFLSRLGGGCLAPVAAYATIDEGTILVRAVVGDPDGVELLRDQTEGPVGKGEELGEQLAARMLESGAGEILKGARE